MCSQQRPQSDGGNLAEWSFPDPALLTGTREEKMNAVRLEYFKKDGPCGTGVRVDGFAYPDLLIEIEAIAFKPLD